MNAIETLFEQNEHLAVITLHKVFPQTNSYARSKNLEYDDLLQFARIGLWYGCKSYIENKPKTSFKAHLIRNIKWNLFRSIHNTNKQFQLYKSKMNDENNKVNVISINSCIDQQKDDLTFEDIMSFDNLFTFESNNPEVETLSTLGKSEILRMLKKGDLELIQLRDAGYTLQEIANKYGVRRQAINAKFVRMQRNLTKKLGVVVG